MSRLSPSSSVDIWCAAIRLSLLADSVALVLGGSSIYPAGGNRFAGTSPAALTAMNGSCTCIALLKIPTYLTVARPAI
jgi:hypothetical protein